MKKLDKILIVGCHGRMGSMLYDLACQHNLSCIGIDQPLTTEKVTMAAKGVTFALFCVPVVHLEEVLRKVCPHLNSDCIVSDITSVKEVPIRYMQSQWPGDVVGTHPLFGPKYDLLATPTVVIVQAQASLDAVLMTELFFQTLGFAVLRSSAEEHDRAMACIQNLNFISNIAYFALLAEQNQLLPFITPSFLRRLNAAQKMITEDGEMFSGLFEANPYSQEMVRKYGAILNLAASGDIELLCQRAKWWWKQ